MYIKIIVYHNNNYAHGICSSVHCVPLSALIRVLHVTQWRHGMAVSLSRARDTLSRGLASPRIRELVGAGWPPVFF